VCLLAFASAMRTFSGFYKSHSIRQFGLLTILPGSKGHIGFMHVLA